MHGQAAEPGNGNGRFAEKSLAKTSNKEMGRVRLPCGSPLKGEKGCNVFLANENQ